MSAELTKIEENIRALMLVAEQAVERGMDDKEFSSDNRVDLHVAINAGKEALGLTKAIKASQEPTFTRSKGGTAEREEIIRPGHRILKVNRERFADMLIETWHLAHDMRKHLQANG